MQAAGECADEHGSGTAVDWAGLPLTASTSPTWTPTPTSSGRPASTTTSRPVPSSRTAAALRGGIDTVRDGLFTRGVLLDIPKVRGGEPLGPDDGVTAAEIEAAEEATGVRVEPGDVILVRTGYGGSRKDRARGEISKSQPGVGTDCLPWIRAREPAVLGTDTATDPTSAHNGRVDGARPLDLHGGDGHVDHRRLRPRGARRHLRAARAVGIPLLGRAAPTEELDGIAIQPDRRLLTARS